MADPTFDTSAIKKDIKKARSGKRVNFAFGMGATFADSVLVTDHLIRGKALTQKVKSVNPKVSLFCFGRITAQGTNLVLHPSRSISGMLNHLQRKFRAASLSKYALSIAADLEPEEDPEEEPSTWDETDQRAEPEKASGIDAVPDTQDPDPSGPAQWARAQPVMTAAIAALPISAFPHSPVHSIWAAMTASAGRDDHQAALARIPELKSALDDLKSDLKSAVSHWRRKLGGHVDQLKVIPHAVWESGLPGALTRAQAAGKGDHLFDSDTCQQAHEDVTRLVHQTRRRWEASRTMDALTTDLADMRRDDRPHDLDPLIAQIRETLEDTNTPLEEAAFDVWQAIGRLENAVRARQ